jgi:glycosyltransferase involved in cell wall biosynthesis
VRAVAEDLVRHFSCSRAKISVVHHGFEDGVAHGAEAAQSDESREHGEERLSENRVLENFGAPAGTPYIFYVGRLEEKKNLVRLVEAFLKFRETHPDWRLILAGGRGFGFERIFDIVERSDAWGSVVMPGYVTNEEREILYRHCRFSAFVSLAEGFGFPILESMAHGRDVLMSDLPVMREIAGGAYPGEFVDPLEVDSIAQGLSRLADTSKIGDPAKDLAMKKLRSIAASYRWEDAAKETLVAISHIIAP